MLVVYIAMCTVYTYILKLALYSIMQDENAIIYMVINLHWIYRALQYHPYLL